MGEESACPVRTSLELVGLVSVRDSSAVQEMFVCNLGCIRFSNMWRWIVAKYMDYPLVPANGRRSNFIRLLSALRPAANSAPAAILKQPCNTDLVFFSIHNRRTCHSDE